MTYYPSVHDAVSESADAEAAKAMPLLDIHAKKVKDAIDDIIEAAWDRLREEAGYWLTSEAASRAECFLQQVLKGNTDAANELFESGGSHRHRALGHDEGKPWASVIHGNIFLTDTMKTRESLVAAHPELLKNERIADLESIVEGLRLQIVKLEADLDRSRYQ